jgi:hypothetical protein
MKQSSIEIDLGAITMSCTADEIAATLAALLGEMRAVIPKLRQDERDVLRQIMSQDSGTLTVADIFPDFTRESEGHKTLRRFRAAQFVRPAKTGRWDPHEPIEVKPFARLMWDHIGEDAIFDGIHPVPMAAPVEEVVDLAIPEDEKPAEPPVATPPEEDEVVDLQDVEEEPIPEKPVEEEPVVMEKAAGFADENLDLGDYDDLCAYAEEELRGRK